MTYTLLTAELAQVCPGMQCTKHNSLSNLLLRLASAFISCTTTLSACSASSTAVIPYAECLANQQQAADALKCAAAHALLLRSTPSLF